MSDSNEASIKALKCPSCSAPAPIPDPDARYAKCVYCGASYAIRHPLEPYRPRKEPVLIYASPERASTPPPSSRSFSSKLLFIIPFLPAIIVTLTMVGPANIPLVNRLPGIRWDGKEPFTCSGNDDRVIDGVTADLAGYIVVSASSNCHLQIRNSSLRGKIAILASGNAEVNIVGGEIEGSEISIETDNNAEVLVSGAVLKGRQIHKGNSHIH